jgi:predicted secreted Zn-dependent protease
MFDESLPISRAMKCLFVSVLCLSVGATAADAKPKIKVVNKTYSVNATTAQDLIQQMDARGPKGFWAYTDWYVKWTGGCDLSVSITYTMPKHKNEAKLDPELRKSWQSFVTALRKHEELHGAHGIQAAQEIEKSKCADGDSVIRKWSEQDKVLDQRTDHGKKDGVVLK